MRENYREKFVDPDIVKKIEELENSPQMQERLYSIKNEMKGKIFNPIETISSLGLVGIILVLLLSIFLRYYILIVLVLGWGYISKFLNKRKVDVANLYANNFLLPVLENILPNTKVSYFQGINHNIIKNFFSNTDHYKSSCHIIFGDEYKTEFSNLEIYHYIEDQNGHNKEVIDFLGQVLVANFKTNINGQIRIVPVRKKNFFGNKKYGNYKKKFKDEREIETEFIEFNDSYSIFSTDDFYTRLILDSKIMEILNKWKDRMEISIYINEDYLAITFKSYESLFYLPTTKDEVDKLSLSGEYEKVREKLADLYGLIDNVGEKL